MKNHTCFENIFKPNTIFPQFEFHHVILELQSNTDDWCYWDIAFNFVKHGGITARVPVVFQWP